MDTSFTIDLYETPWNIDILGTLFMVDLYGNTRTFIIKKILNNVFKTSFEIFSIEASFKTDGHYKLLIH